MKRQSISLLLVATLALGLASCSKTESVSPNEDAAGKAAASVADTAARTAEAAKAEAEKAATAARTEATKVADAAKTEAAKAADAAKTEAAKVADAAKVEAAKAEAAQAADYAKSQVSIDKVKSLIAEGKYAEAASMLQQLSGQALSGDQTKLVASLKEQIQKALAAKATENAAGNVGNLLKK